MSLTNIYEMEEIQGSSPGASRNVSLEILGVKCINNIFRLYWQKLSEEPNYEVNTSSLPAVTVAASEAGIQTEQERYFLISTGSRWCTGSTFEWKGRDQCSSPNPAIKFSLDY